MSETPQQRALKRTAPLEDDRVEHVKPAKAASLVAQRLRGQIVRGELGEGDLLPAESVLMERFNVSRPTLREAFRVLEAENLVSIRRGARGGASVQIPDENMAARHLGFVLEHRGATIGDVYLARETLEASAVRMLAAKRTKADVEALRRRQAEIEELALPQPMLYAHNSLTFHQLIVELTGNQTLAVLDGAVNKILLRANESGTRSALARGDVQPNIQSAHDEHAEVIELIEQKDPDAAERVWRRHCSTTSRDSIESDGRPVLDLLED